MDRELVLLLLLLLLLKCSILFSDELALFEELLLLWKLVLL